MNSETGTDGSQGSPYLFVGRHQGWKDFSVFRYKQRQEIQQELIEMSYRMRKKEHLLEDLDEMSFWNQDKALGNG